MSLGVDFERYQFDKRLRDLQDKVLTLNFRTPPQQAASPPSSNPNYLSPQYYPAPLNAQPYAMMQPQLPPTVYYYPQPMNEDESSSDEEDFKPKPTYSPIKLPTANTLSQKTKPITPYPEPYIIEQQRIAQKQFLDQMNAESQATEKNLLEYIEKQNNMIQKLTEQMVEEKKKQEETARLKEEQELREQHFKLLEKQLVKKSQLMLQDMKSDILDTLQPYPYNYFEPQPLYNQSSGFPTYPTYSPYLYYPPYPQISPAYPSPIPQQPYYAHPPVVQQPQMYTNGMAPPPLMTLQQGQSKSSLAKIGQQSMNKVDQLLSSLK